MIQSFDFVVFIDDLKGTAANLATTFGFVEQTCEYGIRHFTAGAATWLIHQARNAAERNLLAQRGPAPYLIGLKTADKAVPHPYSLLGLPCPDSPYCFSLDEHLFFCQTPPDWRSKNSLKSSMNYTAIDHFAIACAKSKVSEFVHELITTYDFHMTYQLNVEDGNSGMQSIALANKNGNVRLPIIGPDGDQSQVQMFLNKAKGTGIQHIGLHTDNIIETVTQLKSFGVKFLSVKPDYYECEAFQAMPISNTDKQACKELNILADKDDDDHYLLQIFTEPMLGPMMIEIIERHQHNTFGAKNIKSLFDTVADYQNRQSNIEN